MKKIYIGLFWACILGITGCYEDDSTMATPESMVNEITIEEFADTSAVAYSTVLELTPKVTGYSDTELEYRWYIYGGEFSDRTEDGYRTVQIGAEKKLSYPVELKIGTYTVVCEVTNKETGYFNLTEFSLKVTSAFSEGFYILKETTDGNTDMDFYNDRQKTVIPDVIASVQGEAQSGKPCNMCPVYNKIYIDPATAKSTYATGVFVTSGQNEFSIYSTIDMSTLFDRSSLLFSEMDGEEVPYAMVSAMRGNMLFSNKGVRLDDLGGGRFASEYSTGKLGYPAGKGTSSFIQAYDGQNLSFWSGETRRLMYTSGSDMEEIKYKDGYEGVKVDWEQAAPVASGWNHRDGKNTIWYLFDVAGEGRYVVVLQPGGGIDQVIRLDASLHLAKADVIAGNALTSTSIYGVDDNRLYRYSLTEGTETSAIPVEGLPAGTITYMADLFYGSSFDYIVIGIQNGDEYTLSMYKIAGGQPSGKPVHTVTGTGILKKVCYACPLQDYASPNYYAFTKYAELYGMGPDFPY